MLHKGHGDKGAEDEDGGIGEESLVADVFQQPARHDGGGDLGGHGEGVVKAREPAHLAALAHFNNHGQGVDIDKRPGHAHQDKQDIQHRGELVGDQGVAEGGGEGAGQQQGAEADGLAAAQPGGDVTGGM